jgi:uncharacterized membrane protein
MVASAPEQTCDARPRVFSPPRDPEVDTATYQTAVAHLYRGEMHRMATWRTRLDTTSHWAIILSIGLTTFALGSSAVPHYVMLLALSFNSIFMLIEGRRYQHLLHSKWRLGLLERNHFARLFAGGVPDQDPSWRVQLARDLQEPHFTVSLFMGTRLRLRRNYLLIMGFVTVVWLAKVFIHPSSPRSLPDFYQRLAVEGFLPAWFVALTAAAFVMVVALVAALTPSEAAVERRSFEEHGRLQGGERPGAEPNP